MSINDKNKRFVLEKNVKEPLKFFQSQLITTLSSKLMNKILYIYLIEDKKFIFSQKKHVYAFTRRLFWFWYSIYHKINLITFHII